MSYVKLTKQVIADLPQQERTYIVWDTQQQGLGVRALANHSTYHYVIKTPSFIKVLAPVDAMSLSMARQKVQEWISQPNQEKQRRSKRIIRFDEFVRNDWLVNIASQWKPSTQKGTGSMLSYRLLPEFGRYPIHQIDSCHVQRWFDEVSQEYAGAANRNLDTLRSIFDYAVKQGYCLDNPCLGIKVNRQKVMSRFLSMDELSRLTMAFEEVSQRSLVDACCCQILQLILLTGCRISEVVNLRWEYVKGDEWHLPDSKTGAKVVYVGEEARKLLFNIRLKQYSNEEENCFPLLNEFVSKEGRVGRVWQEVRVMANIEDVRVHDLRHTFASYAVLEGCPLPMVAKLLGHKRISSTLRYTHVADSHIEAQAQHMGDVITHMLQPPKEHPKVIKTTPKKKAQKPKRKIVKKSKVSSSSSNKQKDRYSELASEDIFRLRMELELMDW